MKYEKPEVISLGAASAMIQSASLLKGRSITEQQCDDGSPNLRTNCPAYEADE
jgi:hypothetical protein